mgnify:CR=1 FL=1
MYHNICKFCRSSEVHKFKLTDESAEGDLAHICEELTVWPRSTKISPPTVSTTWHFLTGWPVTAVSGQKVSFENSFTKEEIQKLFETRTNVTGDALRMWLHSLQKIGSHFRS